MSSPSQDLPLLHAQSWACSKATCEGGCGDGCARDPAGGVSQVIEVAGVAPHVLEMLVGSAYTHTLELSARSIESGALLSQAIYEGLPPHQLDGCLGLVSHLGTKESRAGFWFKSWTLEGTKLERHPERAWGPVLSCQHTLS